MKKFTLLLCVVLSTTHAFSQEKGTPSVKVFANFNADMSESSNYKEFEIKRSYLGYKYSFNEDFNAKITFDVGSNSSGSAYTAFLKVASLNWKASDHLSLDLGQIGTKNFKFMEKAWGRRYIEKSALDKYKWASSADIGVGASYKISNGINIDAQIINGEGYKKTQADGLFRTGAGITMKISENLSVRVFRDILPHTEDSLATQNITSGAAYYKGNRFSVGLERNLMENTENNSGMNKDLLSIYGSINLGDFILFARTDRMSSENNWDINKDGEYRILGVEHQLTKGVTVALNVQSWKDANLEGDPESEEERTLYLNLEYKF